MTQETQPMTDADRWQAVLARDKSFDGAFFYAVRSTRIYCRPSCPSRKPGRAQVAFYDLSALAERAGYRSCLRCRPRDAEAPDPRIEAVRLACRHMDANDCAPPTLAALGRVVGLSPSHLQRVFKKTLGISPRQYADAGRLGRVRDLLRAGDDVAGAAYQAGYGSSSRLYEKSDAQLGMTPARFRKGGAGTRLRYSIRECALGLLLVAAAERGVCFVALGDDDAGLEAALARDFPAAERVRDEDGLGDWVEVVLALVRGEELDRDLPIDIRATAFQRRVWMELSAIPKGETSSYKDIARRLGQPKAARAVGGACAGNPLSLIVPCHRAVREDGSLGGYRWGLERKKALLASEREVAARKG